MRRATAIQKDASEIGTVEDLTSVFESIASTQVAKVKNKVELSKEFFSLLWTIYRSIRIDPNLQIVNRGFSPINGDEKIDTSVADKQVFIIISAEAGLSGDIDQRLIETMLKSYDPATTDIIVIGSHGASQLVQRSIPTTTLT
jgi:F0F1-type ATP synthase gamma subunit